MRRHSAARSALAIALVAGCLAPIARGQGPFPPRKPQGKVLVFQPPAETAAPSSAVIGVMGHVRHPGTYQFPQPPTLQAVLEAGGGPTQNASAMLRIVRGYRVAQRVTYPAAAPEKLQSGDLVIIDTQAAPPGAVAPTQPAPQAGVQLALLGVIDRPLVVLVKQHEAKAHLIAQKLGQGPDVMTGLRVIPSPEHELELAKAAPSRTPPDLPDCSVLIFDPRRIQLGELPDDLPKVLPCGLEETPDIGAYGVHNAIDERPAPHLPPPQRRQPPPAAAPVKATPIVPPPPESSRLPVPIAEEDNRLPATFSSGDRGTTPISRVPFSAGDSLPVTQTAPISASAPSQQSHAADAQEPAWNQLNSAADVDAEFADETNTGRGAMSAWQMIMILSSAGSLIAIGLVFRNAQQREQNQKAPAIDKQEQRHSSGSRTEHLRSQPHPPVPAPHAAFQAILKPNVGISHEPEPMIAAETLDIRQQRFDQLIKNQLPLIQEPIALRPGLRITLEEEQPILRADAGTSATFHPHAPMIRPTIETPAQTTAPRQIIDEAHPRIIPQPHHRVGVEAPVERALRQLQKGLS